MEFSNEKIKALIAERNKKVLELDREILSEIEKEKAKYEFSWKRFLLMIGCVAWFVLAVNLNSKLFPKTSIWSWDHYKTINKP